MRGTWTREDFRRWVAALTLTAEGWLREVLVPLGIGRDLANHGDLFEALRDEAIKQGSRWLRENEAGIANAIGAALRQLATASSIEDARSFQRWSRRHFICRDAPIALHVWRQVLQHSIRPPGGVYDHVLLAEPIAVVVRQAAELVTNEQTKPIEDRIYALAPPPGENDFEIGFDLSSQALSAIEVVQGEATVAALVHLAKRLNADERQFVSRWAERQAAALDIPPDRLGGERFLREEPTCRDAPPSILIGYPR